MNKIIKSVLIGLAFLPSLTLAVTAVGWNTPTPTTGWVLPNAVNGTNQAIRALGGLFTSASSTFSGNFFLPALSQGFAFLGTNGLLSSIASSSVRLSWFNNDAGFITSSASTTLLSDFNTWTGRNNFAYASTTGFSTSYASSTAGYFGTLGVSTSSVRSGYSLEVAGNAIFNDLAPFQAVTSPMQKAQNEEVVTAFQVGNGFTYNSGGGSSSADTSDYVIGTQSLKIITDSSGTQSRVQNLSIPSFSVVGKTILATVKVDKNFTTTDQLFIGFSSDNFTNYFYCSFTYDAFQHYYGGDWFNVSCSPSDYNTTGSPNLSAITAIRLYVRGATGTTHTAWFNKISLVPNNTSKKGVVSITFDDGSDGQYTYGLPVLATTTYNYPATAYIETDVIGNVSYMTKSNLDTLQNVNGWEIAAHYQTSFAAMTYDQQENAIVTTKNWLIKNGYGKGADSFAYPQGEAVSTTTLPLMRKYFTSARMSSDGRHETFPIGNPYALKVFPVKSTTATSTVYAAIDAAAANHDWLILVFHKIVPSGASISTEYNQRDLQYIADYLYASRNTIEVKTVNDVINRNDDSLVRLVNNNLGISSTTPWKQLSVGSSNTGTFAISTSTAGTLKISSTGEVYSDPSGGSGTPAGSNGQLQYNASGAFGGVSTTTVNCSGSVSCSQFITLGSSPITITGSGTVSTSTPLVSGQVAFSTGVSTIGNDSNFTFDSATDKLTVTYASTTGVTFNNAFSTSTGIGGDNTTDTTGRINLYSYQKAEQPNSFGEVMRIYLASTTAKGMLAWYDATTTTPLLKAWIGYHYGANDVSDPLNPHDHFAIETPDSTGLLRTRMEFLAQALDTTQINTFNSNFTVVQGTNGVSGLDGQSKPFSIYTAGTARGKTLRWSMQGNSTSETGSDAGTDFQISSFNDAGAFTRTPFFIKRSSGNVGISSTSPFAKLGVEATTDLNAVLIQNTTMAGNNSANLALKTQTSSSRVLQAGLQSDSINRFSIEASGLHEWGAGGASGRDTNLYRSAANTLATDDLLTFPYSSSTAYSSFLTASSTRWVGGGLQACDPTTGKTLWNATTLQWFCGTDGGGGSGGIGDPFTHATAGLSATTSAMAIGTSTNPNLFPILGFSSTLPQLALSAGAGLPMWTMRNAGGNLYFATTTVAGTATTSTSALVLNNDGSISMASSTSLTIPIVDNCAPGVVNGKICFDSIARKYQTGSATTSTGTLPRVISMQYANTDAKYAITGTSEQAFATKYTIPANLLQSGKMLRVTMSFLASSTAAGPTVTARLRLGGIGGTIVAQGLTANAGAITSRSGSIQFYITGTAVPSASAPVDTGFMGHGTDGASFGRTNTIVQPVNVATNASQDLTFTIQYSAATAGNGTHLRQLLIEEI